MCSLTLALSQITSLHVYILMLLDGRQLVQPKGTDELRTNQLGALLRSVCATRLRPATGEHRACEQLAARLANIGAQRIHTPLVIQL